MTKVKLFDIDFDNYDFNDLKSFIDNKIQHRKNSYIVTCNVDHIMKLQKDKEFKRVYNEADLVIADGMPIIWASHLLRKPIKEKISGSDIIPFLISHFAEKKYKLFFLGAAPGVAQKAAENLKEKYPNVSDIGFYSPTYGFEEKPDENRMIINMLNEFKPDILFVGVGAPKQEKWINKNFLEIDVPISIGIGATLDFLAGNVKRAPISMQKSGLEWLYRLLQEPRRLWRRYLIEDSQFLLLLIKEILKSKK
jgi:N-acetylglucosaminyldiphosphoundecaprenol N-acetyl-beta-D-mannosaminyltransferase